MNQYAVEIVAASRREDFLREAAAENLARLARRRGRRPRAEQPSAHKRSEVARPAVA